MAALAAAMMLSFAGCEKKADIVEGNTVSEEAVSGSGDNSQIDTEDENTESGDSERWTENLTGDGSGFESVDVSATLYDYSKKELSTCTVQIEEFNSDNTYRLNIEETKAKIAALEYIQKELSGEGNFVQ